MIRRRVTSAVGSLLLLLTACDPSTPADPGSADPLPPDPDCLAEQLEAEGCLGCHMAESPAQGLDLASPMLGQRLAGAQAHTESCQGRVLIDRARPERSLLLQAVGLAPPPAGDDDPCQLVMPRWRVAPVSDAAAACLTGWVDSLRVEPPDLFEPTPAEAALAKVKALVDGRAPTEAERAAVAEDPAALRALLTGWTDLDANPRFERKLSEMLSVALQQRLEAVTPDQFDRLRTHGDLRAPARRVLEASFVRTAVDIVRRGAPFTEVVTTRRWMLTTAGMALLRYTEQTADERDEVHTIAPAEGAPPPVAEQVAARRWVVPGLAEGVGRCDDGIAPADVLDLLFGFVDKRCHDRESNLRWPTPPIVAVAAEGEPSAFDDWRLVELVGFDSGEPLIPFYDLPALRAVDARLRLRVPRAGFFSTPAFFSNWPTNIDNQFRVTTNQTVLAALHGGFSQTEPTPRATADDAAIPLDHAALGSSCYGCHKNLDPMRIYFARSLTVDYQRPFAEEVGAPGGPIYAEMPQPGFALFGQQRVGGKLSALGRALAEHPRFAIGWAQKLCLYANSARCDEADPAFTAIVERFRQGYDLRALVVDLFSSPLVTGLEASETWPVDGPPISITRRGHLCAMLDARADRPGVCEAGRVRPHIGLIPRDDFARGAADPTQPSLPSAFHFAAARRVCEATAELVVRGEAPVYAQGDPEAAIDAMVERLMGLPPGHPRHASTRALLTTHYEDARADGANQRNAVRSTFAAACLSPDVMGMGL